MPKRVLVPYRHARKLEPYLDALLAAGAEPVASHVDEPVLLENISGILLMGGTDVNPSRYGAAAWPETDTPDDVRDQVEWGVIDAAMSGDVPLFAICRGLQVLNAHHGGTLIQHLSLAKRHDVDTPDKGEPAHEVLIAADSLLEGIAQATKWRVNSRHHQAADRVGAGLRVVARDSEDGTIEGMEQPDKRFVLAVQWHPEDQVNRFPEQQRLFDRFVEAL